MVAQLGKSPPDGGYDYDVLLTDIRVRKQAIETLRQEAGKLSESEFREWRLLRDLMVTIGWMDGPVAVLAQEALKDGATLDPARTK